MARPVKRDAQGRSASCARRRHTAPLAVCAGCACACHALANDTRDAYRVDDATVRALMGERGEWYGRAYAWCERGSHYHVEALPDASRGVRGVPNGSYAGHARSIVRRAARTRQQRRVVRVVRVARIMPRTPDDVMPLTPARVYADAYAAQRA